jgi:hypothetical protein
MLCSLKVVLIEIRRGRLEPVVVLHAGVELLLVGDGVIHAESVEMLFVGVGTAVSV